MQIYSFSFPHKTASMFAYRIADELSKRLGIPLYSGNSTPSNFDEFEKETKDAVVGPLRNYVISSILRRNAGITSVRDIAQIRDPLDVCVSQYFSHGWSHGEKNWPEGRTEQRRKIKAGEISLSRYVRMALDGEAEFGGNSILQKWSKLEVKNPAVTRTVVRYEDMMLDPGKWARQVAEGLGVNDDAFVATILEMQPDYPKPDMTKKTFFGDDIKDYLENHFSSAHVRWAWPGQHKVFLAPNEVKELRKHIAERQPKAADCYK